MTGANKDMELDEVLFSFHKACENPTAEQIAEWAKRYPQFAEEILSHASLLKDWAAKEKLSALEPDETMLSRGQSRTLDALYKARAAAKECTAKSIASNVCPAPQTFKQIMKKTGTSIPGLAKTFDIARSILSDLFGGRMKGPIGERLQEALTGIWSIPVETLNQAIQSARANPTLGTPRAESTPTIIPRTYEELVRASSMSDPRKRYWLGED